MRPVPLVSRGDAFLISSVWSEPKLGSARFWLELLGKKARLGSPYLAKKLSSARLALFT